MIATTMSREQFVEWLRSEFPKLLQEDPRFSAEVVGILSQTLGSRAEFNRLLEEIRRLREDGERRFEAMERRFEAIDRRFEALQEEMARRFEAADRRFEAIDRRFEAIDRRFEALQEEMARRFEAADRRFEAIERTLAVHGRILEQHSRLLEEHSRLLEAHSRTLEEHSRKLEEHSVILRHHTALLQKQLRELRGLHVAVSSMGDRRGRALEETVRMVIEEFSGVGPLRAERLVLHDADGEVFGVRGHAIEFDCFVHDGRRFLVEVKSFAKPGDVALFFRKLQFAERHLQGPFERIMIAPYARKGAVELARQLGIEVLTLKEEVKR